MVKSIGELDPQGSGQADLSKTLLPYFITPLILCQELRPDPIVLFQIAPTNAWYRVVNELNDYELLP